MKQFALKVTCIWTLTSYLHPTLFNTWEEADKQIKKMPQATVNNKIDVVEITI